MHPIGYRQGSRTEKEQTGNKHDTSNNTDTNSNSNSNSSTSTDTETSKNKIQTP